MAVYGPVTLLTAMTSFLLNFLCNFVLPIIEKVASKLRLGCEFKAPAPAAVPPEQHGKRRKKKGTSSTPGAHSSQNGTDGKWLKLLVNVTVRQVKKGSSSKDGVEVEETSSYVIEDDPNKNGFGQRVYREPGIITWIINFPSTITLAVTAKLREWAHKLDSSKSGDGRVMRSPRRRINKSDYRKIIPFFPYNLLGFSNYSPFQMPHFTTPSSETSPAKSQGLNTSKNEKPRHKRQRPSSTECSSLSDEDFSHLELCDVSGHRVDIEGCDVVDSDASSDTKITAPTEPITSSSSASNGNTDQKATTSFSVTTTNGKTTLEEEGPEDEVHVISAFYKELDEAANESYNSRDDPDYKPPFSTSEESSFVSGATGDSDSFLQSGPTPDDSINVKNDPEEKTEQKGPESLLMDDEEHKNPTPCEDDYKTPNEEDEHENKGVERAQYEY